MARPGVGWSRRQGRRCNHRAGRRRPVALWSAVGFCALAAAADLHELRIQTDRSKTGLAVIAGTVAAIHVVGAIAGMFAAREPTQHSRPPPA